MGAVIASDQRRRAVPRTGTRSFTHGFTFGGHPVAAAVALANIDVFEREDLIEHVRAQRGRVPGDARLAARPPDRRRRARRGLLPGDRAGQGPGDQGDASTHEESERLLRGFLSGELFTRGLICRADDRGDPVDPALAAADRRARSSSRRSSRSCARCSRRRRERLRTRGSSTAMLTARRPRPRARRRASSPASAGARPRRALGAHLRARGPDAVAVGRRAAADHRAAARATPTQQREYVARLADARARRPRASAPASRTSTCPRRCVEAAARARLPAVRGALRGAVHRDHREGVHAPGQRALRGAAARAVRARAARADRALRARARRRRRRAGVADRRRRR